MAPRPGEFQKMKLNQIVDDSGTPVAEYSA
jgi:hypothetical protein